MLHLAITFALAAPAALVQDAGPEAGAPQAPPAPIDPARFDELWDLVVPDAEEEAWRALGWRTTFWQGVCDANELDRPVLLFAMNGHPFGCT